jgi:hypothetical protein
MLCCQRGLRETERRDVQGGVPKPLFKGEPSPYLSAKFHVGDKVVLVEDPHKYVHGAFMGLKDDLEWATVEQANGALRSHPVEWMRNNEKPVPSVESKKE